VSLMLRTYGVPGRRRRRRPRGLKAVLVGLLASALVGAPAVAGSAQASTLYVPWSSVLPGWTDQYVPTSSNICVAGKPACLNVTLNELNKVFTANAKSCSHLAIFSLAYLRMTQTYGWARSVPGYYQDVPFANHLDAVFAKYFTDAYYNWKAGKRSKVPAAWLLAFDAAKSKTVTGTGDLLLGMNAHINRDLPFVLAATGLVAPDGSSRKPDYDKDETWLAQTAEPMLAEAAQRFDPTVDDADEPTGTVYGSVMAVISAWREQAWREAELLVSATTAAQKAQISKSIESNAKSIAQGIVATNSYTPPLSTTTSRDAYCSMHKGDTAPMPYLFGTAKPYGY
jgi:hypothetical protein